MNTITDLPKILRARGAARYKTIIDKAVVGTYHDYKSQLNMCKVELVNDLARYPELEDIKQAVMEGKYDEEADDTDKDNLRQDLLSDGVGDSLFTALGLEVPTPDERLTGRVKSKN